MKSILCKLLAVALCLSALPVFAMAAEQATDITEGTEITVTAGYDTAGFLTDGNVNSYRNSDGDATIHLSNPDGMAGIYLMFDLEYGAYTIEDNLSGKTFTAGTYGMLHEYVDLVAAFGTEPTEITLSFTNGRVRLSEISVFSTGELISL